VELVTHISLKTWLLRRKLSNVEKGPPRVQRVQCVCPFVGADSGQWSHAGLPHNGLPGAAVLLQLIDAQGPHAGPPPSLCATQRRWPPRGSVRPTLLNLNWLFLKKGTPGLPLFPSCFRVFRYLSEIWQSWSTGCGPVCEAAASSSSSSRNILPSSQVGFVETLLLLHAIGGHRDPLGPPSTSFVWRKESSLVPWGFDANL
jgi:hypothetical protein